MLFSHFLGSIKLSFVVLYTFKRDVFLIYLKFNIKFSCLKSTTPKITLETYLLLNTCEIHKLGNEKFFFLDNFCKDKIFLENFLNL